MQVAKMFPVRKGSHPGKLLDRTPATSISLSKLADESQLGSLSKLLTPAHNNNVNDCNYEAWPAEVPVEPVNNNCNPQYESTFHYKSSMPLKKRFRQDFVNDLIKEEPQAEPANVSVCQSNISEEMVTSEAKARTTVLDVDKIMEDQCFDNIVEPPKPKTVEVRKESRTTKFRACKGERYKIFMNSNRRTRNKTNRWDLRQKSISSDKLLLDGDLELQQRINDLSHLDTDDFNKSPIRNKRPKKINKTKRKKRLLSPTKSTASVDNCEEYKTETEDFLDLIEQEKKSIKEEVNAEIKEEVDSSVQMNGNTKLLEVNKGNGFEDDADQTNLVDDIKTEYQFKTINSDLIVDNFENKTGTVVGSRKRKLRKQNIMRLQPGSTFKDMRVVEDSVVCDLGTLAEVAVSSEEKPAQENVLT